MKYKSRYSELYLNNNKVGETYNKRINNKFEVFIFELEKYFLNKIIYPIQSPLKNYMDFACGTGRIISYVYTNFKFKRYLGIDLSRIMIAQAQKGVQKGIFFKVADISRDNNIPKQDVITCFRLFLNLEDYNRKIILKSLNKLLKKDGYLIINNHLNRFSFLGAIAFILHNFFGFPFKREPNPDNKKTILNTLKNSELKDLIESCGFEVKKIYSFCFFPGYKNYIFLPKKILFVIEKAISKINFLSFFAKDAIFLCKKIMPNK
ncbi:MAG: class I SAM-dependent methyltransferase [Candidatus Nanoarchaeia archaeon]|jgi:SAM-dependent methyltransferase